jgi:hypothetical protein
LRKRGLPNPSPTEWGSPPNLTSASIIWWAQFHFSG